VGAGGLYARCDHQSIVGGTSCRDGTSPRCGRSWPRSCPTPQPRSRGSAAPPGPSSTGGRTGWPRRSSLLVPPTRTRSPSTSTTALSTWSRSTGRGRPAWSRSTPTTATPRTSCSTCGTTQMRSPWSSRASSPDGSRHQGPPAQGAALALGWPTGRGPAPGGATRTRRRLLGHRADGPAVGPAAPTTSYMLYTGGTPACPRASCGARTTSSRC
jgi:hypothetical protein